jgi:hypothetical protein
MMSLHCLRDATWAVGNGPSASLTLRFPFCRRQERPPGWIAGATTYMIRVNDCWQHLPRKIVFTSSTVLAN